MRFYNRQHRHYCGIDLHVKTMYVCILDATGQVLVHRNVQVDAGGLSRGGGSVPGGSGRRRRVHVHLVLARGCLRGRRDRLRARPCAGDEGHPRGEGQERQARLVQDREPAPRRAAATGVCVSGGHAGDAGPDPPSAASGAETRPALGAHSEHAGAVQPAGLRPAARLSGQSRGRRRALLRSQCAQEHRGRSDAAWRSTTR